MAAARIIAGATVFGAIIGAHAPDSFRRQHIPVESTNVVGATQISAMPGRVIHTAIRFVWLPVDIPSVISRLHADRHPGRGTRLDRQRLPRPAVRSPLCRDT